VIRNTSIRYIPIMLLLIASTAVSARRRSDIQRATVRFLATSTVVRGTWAYNQDTYLAEFVPSGSNQPLLIRLVDEYLNAAPPISTDTLTSSTGTALRVKRDSSCDLPYADILLRTRPGDPLAILPERLGYLPRLDSFPDPGRVIPCYRTVRQ
jgi:hypothetical protein